MSIEELEQCIQRFGTDILSFCRYLTGSSQEAEDLYQDTFLVAMKRLPDLEGSQNVKSYLLGIAVKIWKNQKRKYAWRARIAPESELIEETVDSCGSVPGPEEKLLELEEQMLVRRAVSRLTDRYRIPVLFYYTEQMSVREIAELLGLSENAVKSRLHRARRQLARMCEEFFRNGGLL